MGKKISVACGRVDYYLRERLHWVKAVNRLLTHQQVCPPWFLKRAGTPLDRWICSVVTRCLGWGSQLELAFQLSKTYSMYLFRDGSSGHALVALFSCLDRSDTVSKYCSNRDTESPKYQGLRHIIEEPHVVRMCQVDKDYVGLNQIKNCVLYSINASCETQVNRDRPNMCKMSQGSVLVFE